MGSLDIIEQYNALQKRYHEYAAESIACNREVESFEEWAGAINPKQLAQDRHQDIWDRDEYDLY